VGINVVFEDFINNEDISNIKVFTALQAGRSRVRFPMV
jgi:hypothetical protein